MFTNTVTLKITANSLASPAYLYEGLRNCHPWYLTRWPQQLQLASHWYLCSMRWKLKPPGKWRGWDETRSSVCLCSPTALQTSPKEEGSARACNASGRCADQRKSGQYQATPRWTSQRRDIWSSYSTGLKVLAFRSLQTWLRSQWNGTSEIESLFRKNTSILLTTQITFLLWKTWTCREFFMKVTTAASI